MKNQTGKSVLARPSSTFQISFVHLYLISIMVYLPFCCHVITPEDVLAEKRSPRPLPRYALFPQLRSSLLKNFNSS